MKCRGEVLPSVNKAGPDQRDSQESLRPCDDGRRQDIEEEIRREAVRACAAWLISKLIAE
jgi:hypothetical protein